MLLGMPMSSILGVVFDLNGWDGVGLLCSVIVKSHFLGLEIADSSVCFTCFLCLCLSDIIVYM